ncbi:metabotropic glutamate receptor 3-like isoform X2 [Tubulanus polymorphus]|uniref:metabotropic glutamate receptor 3-like isoform X2 n=1 Tax=Tubulanus polymorphus TaxID=672921 RepID=UPI003DA24DD8
MGKVTRLMAPRFLFLLMLSSILVTSSVTNLYRTDLETGQPDRNDTHHPSNKAVRIPGDIILGGLFPVHTKGSGDKPCGLLNGERGIQRLETMLYTINEINARTDILTNITLGANILDTCSRETYALEQSLEYVRASMSTLDASEFICSDNSKAKPKSSFKAVAGVVGGAYSTVSIQVANLLRLFKIPQISYASTSAALSDKGRFNFFARTLPPDTFQAKAMVDIVEHFNWTYVSTVASDGDYGEPGIDSFTAEARARNICIAIQVKIPANSKDSTFDNIIHELQRKPNAKVVILFIRLEDSKELLDAASRQNVTDQFTWIASDGWGLQEGPVKGNELAAEGAITIELQTNPIPSNDIYFKSLHPRTHTVNPWFTEYWEDIHECQFHPHDNTTTVCSGNEKLTSRIYQPESKAQFIYDAVYVFAYALHNMHRDLCPGEYKLCERMQPIDGTELFTKYILNSTFDDGYGGVVQFDERGDAAGRYHIMNFQRNRSNRRYWYKRVGKWTPAGLQLNTSKMIWAGGTLRIPQSACSQPCGDGEIKNVQQGDTCCWVCTKCQPWEFLRDEFTCEDCGTGRWPHSDRKTCFSLQEQYMKWNSVFAIVPSVLSCIGILMTSIVMFYFFRNIDTPIVKASGRELCFMLLSGCLICYTISFILLAKPSTAICAIQRFGVGFGFAVMYASLLTKTNRISRIFDSASRSAKRPAFISPKSQLVICTILISIQVLSTCIWLVLEPPGTRQYNPNGRRDQVILKCKIDDMSFLISLVYIMLLIIVCTVYAVKTRKIPENFNESKFIGFTMYTTCIIWLAFVPIYFGTLNSFEIQITTLCVSISLSASVTLVCLFGPKMYIIVFQPEKNVRKLTMNSAHYKKTNTSSITNAGTTGNNHDAGCEHLKPLIIHEGGKTHHIDLHLDLASSPTNCMSARGTGRKITDVTAVLSGPLNHQGMSPSNEIKSCVSSGDEHVKLNIQGPPSGFGTTETDTDLDKDSLASV